MLINKADVDILQASEDYALNQRDRFGYEDGFYIAAGITKYDNDTNPIEREEYGELYIE